MARYFTALDIPVYLHADIAKLQTDLPHAHWSPAANWHITLNFLGDLNENQIVDIDEALLQFELEDFELRLEGAGCFVHEGQSQYLWLKPMPDDDLQKCYQKLRYLFEKQGVHFEKRAYVPHMTLAKIKKTPNMALEKYVTEKAGYKSEFFFAENIILYQSHLTKHGSIYKEIAKYPLKSASQIR